VSSTSYGEERQGETSGQSHASHNRHHTARLTGILVPESSFVAFSLSAQSTSGLDKAVHPDDCGTRTDRMGTASTRRTRSMASRQLRQDQAFFTFTYLRGPASRSAISLCAFAAPAADTVRINRAGPAVARTFVHRCSDGQILWNRLAAWAPRSVDATLSLMNESKESEKESLVRSFSSDLENPYFEARIVVERFELPDRPGVQGAKRSQAGTGALVAGASESAVRTTLTAAYGREYAAKQFLKASQKQAHSTHGSGIDRRQNRGATQNQGAADLNNAHHSSGKRIGRSPRGVDEYTKDGRTWRRNGSPADVYVRRESGPGSTNPGRDRESVVEPWRSF